MRVTAPELSKALFRPIAEASSKKLAVWLESDLPNARSRSSADSWVDEALAALVCAFDSKTLAERNAGDAAVVVRSADALAKVTTASSSVVVILASPEAERESADLPRRHHTIVVTWRNAIEGDADLTIDLVDDVAFREGLTAMGLSDGDVDRLSHESGHSQTVLRRRLATLPAIKSPPWAAHREIANRLIPLVSVGAWNAESDARSRDLV